MQYQQEAHIYSAPSFLHRSYHPFWEGKVCIESVPVYNLSPVKLTECGTVNKVFGWTFVGGDKPMRVSLLHCANCKNLCSFRQRGSLNLIFINYSCSGGSQTYKFLWETQGSISKQCNILMKNWNTVAAPVKGFLVWSHLHPQPPHPSPSSTTSVSSSNNNNNSIMPFFNHLSPGTNINILFTELCVCPMVEVGRISSIIRVFHLWWPFCFVLMNGMPIK